MPSDVFVLGMLRSLFGGINKLSPIFLTFDLLPNMQPQYLLDTIMKTCVEYRSNQNLKAPKVPVPKANANGAVDGGKGSGKKGGGKGGGKSDKSEKCKKCGKANHKAADCWSDKTCTGCKKKGHVWESCFSNPKSASYKPPSNLSNVAAGVTPAQPTGLDAAAILSV